MPECVPCRHVRASAEYQRRDTVDGAEEVTRLVDELLGPWTAHPGRVAGGAGEPVEVFALVVVEQ
ncbi:hypothetical protein GCM10011588_26900 [Nocardia jinanensis]|uniref:Uncharacterized protein n=1 Tax=Nocardia jinanensis TaxID=382504 RepID=A0A917RKQ9_9NOCA|nr:hypothetical protein [Nocardia jinanensis]GGL10997.1 hypothetical protein GCM10011588_26900 [Nocardia jinanensis]